MLASPLATLNLELARPLPPNPLPIIYPTASVSPHAKIGAGATIGAGARVGDRAIVGPAALVGAGARIGTDVVIDALAHVGDDARISTGAYIGPGASVGPGAVMRQGALLGGASTLGAGSVLGGGASCGGNSSIGGDVRIGGGTRLGTGVIVDAGTAVAGRLFIAHGATLSGKRFAADLFSCNLGGTSGIVPLGSVDCELQGGVVLGTLDDKTVGDAVNPDNAPQDHGPANSGVHAADIAGAGQALDAAGIDKKKYVKVTYDCEDFAGEAEKALQAAGYDATFTVFWRLNPECSWWTKGKVKKWIDGHAVIDVHWSDGTTTWLEPQAASTEAGWGLDMDFDGDGLVTYAVEAGDSVTDDSRRIEVYDNREAAEAAGNRLD